MKSLHKKRYMKLALCLAAALCLCACSASSPAQTGNTENTENAGATASAVSQKPKVSSEIAASEETAAPAANENSESDEIERRIKSMSLEDKVDQLFFITPEQLTGLGTVTQAGETTRKSIASHPVGGLIYFEQNLEDTEQTRTMLRSTKQYYSELDSVQPFLGVDEEGGTVTRIAKNSAFGAADVGNMIDIGNTGDSQNAYKAGTTIGSYLKDLGFNLDFAPVADTLTNQNNTVVAKRAFGSDPQLVSSMAEAEVKGLEENGIVPVIKHFPGHGATTDDTHDGYAYTDKTLDEMTGSDLIPFAEAAKQSVPVIMAGHISAPKVTGDNTPASLSSVMITEVLRGRLGFDGIVITDAMNMGAIANTYSSADAAVKAIEAGADMILMPYNFSSARSGIIEAVQNGTISEDRIDESVRRILKVKLHYLQ